MADGEGQGHPIPEGAAGQLRGDVPPQRSAGEGAAPAESGKGASRLGGRSRRRRRGRVGGEQKWDAGE